MPRMITLFLLLASGVHAQTSTPTDWRFAHSDAGIRASINVQSLLKSPMIAGMKDQAPKENQAQIGMALAMLSAIDRVSLSMTAPASQKPAADPAADQDMLILVSGGFDASFLQAMLPPGGSTQIKQVDPHTLLIGTMTPSFTAAVQRLAGASRSGAADELESNDLWLWADVKLLNQLPSSDVQLDGLRSFSFGINAGDKADITLIANTTDAEAAKKLLDTMNMLLKVSGMPADTSAMLAKALDMRADGSKLRLHFVPPPEMLKAAQDQAASPDFSGLQPLLGILGMGGSPSKSAPPDNGGKIVINGLDDGPRVITPK